jgi:hypothetical protein
MEAPAPPADRSNRVHEQTVQHTAGNRELTECVLKDGTGRVLPDTGRYAADRRWYINNEPITWERRRYTKFGPPHVLSAAELRPAGEHDGVVFFVEASTAGTPEVIFLPIRAGCEFHRYQWDLTTGGIRGGF